MTSDSTDSTETGNLHTAESHANQGQTYAEETTHYFHLTTIVTNTNSRHTLNNVTMTRNTLSFSYALWQ